MHLHTSEAGSLHRDGLGYKHFSYPKNNEDCSLVLSYYYTHTYYSFYVVYFLPFKWIRLLNNVTIFSSSQQLVVKHVDSGTR